MTCWGLLTHEMNRIAILVLTPYNECFMDETVIDWDLKRVLYGGFELEN